ncbi:MAG TPA: exodeoxyribonuclease VII small subunit [Bacillota bacterium]|nr:exodeoxyribonuclease VII small subunit [Bacillota bacterium]HOJ83387.1 exodeoxyribonuclease VII small subunit [Bacillota bacterium]HOL14773.1 exodeoxyribonuclease VII small subunit [Bacillota bacterium]HPZ11015.1 exodeoxyribonuclease VII small subunit [Bacillota bacterium]HQE09801.1 exodeoxyribonuclease VII small subunit [Bacillota bacterium]
MTPKENGELSYEEAIRRLEEIVARLENEDIPLEETLAGFKEGVRLARYCREKLAEIEFQVEYLLKEEQEAAGSGGEEPEAEPDEEDL